MADNRMVERIEEERSELARGGRRIIACDRYIVVFVLIMMTIALNAFLGDRGFGVALVGIALALTLAVTLVTSESRRATAVVAVVLAAITLGSAASVAVFGIATELPRLGYKLGLLSMTLLVAVVIGRRILKHPLINLNTLAGAASIYLLFGLGFAVIYSFVGGAMIEFGGTVAVNAARAFFAGARPANPSDFMYFSFVTLTTVGYGDLTAATEVGRMLSVCEALLGQLYW